MADQNKTEFIYVTYIRTTPEKLWDALTKPELTRLYWCECWQDTTWEPGSEWKLMIPDGRVGDSGKVIEVDYPRCFTVTWRNEFVPGLIDEGYSRCTFELEEMGDTVKLVITHTMNTPYSKFIQAISNGWPMILASLKSLLETGDALEATKHWPKGM
jgi:uncharacterized protein YndB with AHSA1/START domain